MFDGSTCNPVKGAGGYHIPGEVGVCTDSIFTKLIETVMPLMDAHPDCMKIIVPPQPRYVFSPCCMDTAHCTNVGSPTHAEAIVSSTIRLRNILKRKLVGKVKGVFWVLDTYCWVDDPQDKQLPEKLSELKGVSA